MDTAKLLIGFNFPQWFSADIENWNLNLIALLEAFKFATQYENFMLLMSMESVFKNIALFFRTYKKKT